MRAKMPGDSKTDISRSLKEYLSRNEGPEGKSLLQSVSANSFSWFSKSSSDSKSSLNKEVPSDDRGTWFSEAETDSLCPTLTRKQRIVGFVGLLCMGFFCFGMAAFYAPFLLIKARKFCLLYSMGSLFVIGSFSALWGPGTHIKHLCSAERLPFTLFYFGSMFLTLYLALWVKNALLTAVCAVCQIVALVWYVVSYIPGGQTGLKFFSKICSSLVTKTASKALPV